MAEILANWTFCRPCVETINSKPQFKKLGESWSFPYMTWWWRWWW